MNSSSTDIRILQRAQQGDLEAIGNLVDRYRSRLKMLIAVRIDRRLVQRIDDSDIIQELFLRLNQSQLTRDRDFQAFEEDLIKATSEDAAQRELAAPSTVRSRKSPSAIPDGISTYVWLRRLALWTLAEVQRKHLGVQQRDPRREHPFTISSKISSFEVAEMFLASGTRPLDAMVQRERSRELARTLEEMDPIDREILTLRHGEQLTRSEAAEILGISIAAAAKRYMRAMKRVREKMKDWEDG
jgi:RNA polymerase sigma-70 factor, ECF subfamily